MNMKRRNRRRPPVTLTPHAAGFALATLAVAVTCWFFKAQCAAYARKINACDAELEVLHREYLAHVDAWQALQGREALDNACRLHGIRMEPDEKWRRAP